MKTTYTKSAMRITKKVDFAAAHSIQGAGKCAKKHGHNWEAIIDVDLDGELDEHGFVADVRDIKQAAFKYDHDDLDNYFETPSTENVAQTIANDVFDVVASVRKVGETGYISVHVHLIETPNNSAHAWAEGDI